MSQSANQAAYHFAAELLVAGVPAQEVEQRLMATHNMSQDSAIALVAQLRKAMVPNMEIEAPPIPAPPRETAIVAGTARILSTPLTPSPLDVTQFSTDPDVQGVYRFAADLLQAGESPSSVRRRLMQQHGIDVEAAELVTNNLQDALGTLHPEQPYTSDPISVADVLLARQEQGKKLLLYGALWFFGGLIVTGLTFAAASGPGGGRYYITWGAVVYGIVDMVRGLSMMSES